MSVAIAAIPKTRTSRPTSCCRGRLPGGSTASSQWIPQIASTRPAIAPTTASRTLSVSSCRITCARPAPSAVLTAISRWRPEARARSVFATLAQAISSTNVTIAMSASSVLRIPETTLSSSGRTVMPRRVFVSGCASSRREARPLISACACRTVTPSLSRPKSRSDRPDRSSSLLASESGTHISARVCQNGANRNPGGMTPTTTYGSPLSGIERPMTAGSAPNRRRHSASLRMTTRSRPGSSSPCDEGPAGERGHAEQIEEIR